LSYPSAETRILRFIADTLVNGNKLVADHSAKVRRELPTPPNTDHFKPIPDGFRQQFLKLGAKDFCMSIRDTKELLLTDTTMRDAHQSLLATRVRTYDMLKVADAYARLAPQFFSLEMWGGATFDTSMRFLKESPWQRLSDLRTRIPNILFQMLLRASNAVGYTNYPDNVVKRFVHEAAQAGVDIFRVFDALNWTENMRVAMDAVIESGMICEAAICYTGDILNPKRQKYSLKYYVDLAKQLEKMGAHMLAVKDMAGLCKPAAARKLVATLRQEIAIPIHFHTHDTAGIQASSILNAADEGLEIADGALASMSGGTSEKAASTPMPSRNCRNTGKQCDNCTHPSRENRSSQEAICTNMKCPAVNTPISINKPKRSDWPIDGTACARPTPKPTRCSETSSK
jgi:pyruvate carboxylase